MSLKTEKDRTKAQQEKFQAVLSNLLKDDDNKYCVDCDAKGPRWASWNLGLFLCIRCAGIHRNLGVHISRVKSVNLDSWTPEQVAMMQEMGNSRARAVYEANIPDGFRRPQTDSALEAFIRAKYEQKKYIAREWVPPKPVVPKDWLDDDKTDKKKLRSKPTSNISLSSSAVISQPIVHNSPPEEAKPTVISATSAKPQSLAQPQTQVPKPKTGSDDLLGLEAEMPAAGSGGYGGDLLEDLFGGSPPSSSLQGSSGQQDFINCQQNGSLDGNLFDGGSGEVSGGKKTAKDSIMALYGSGSQQQMFGVPESVSDSFTPMPYIPISSSGGAVSTASVWDNNPFLCSPAPEYYSQYFVNPSPCFYAGAGGMYMPQQMYGSGIGPMIGQPMTQMPQGMIGIQQPPVYGAMGQMVPQQMPRGMMGSQAPPMMGSQAPPMMGQGGMGGQLYMHQPRNQAQITPQMQQMQYQQMQQQMAAMRVGGGPITGMQQAPAASWGSAGTGQTLSTNLWQ